MARLFSPQAHIEPAAALPAAGFNDGFSLVQALGQIDARIFRKARRDGSGRLDAHRFATHPKGARINLQNEQLPGTVEADLRPGKRRSIP